MKKTLAITLIAFSMTAATPAFAADAKHKDWCDLSTVSQFVSDTYNQMIALLLPAVQKAR